GAELVATKRPPLEPDARMGEDRRTRAGDLDQDDDEDKQRRGGDQRRCRDDDISEAFAPAANRSRLAVGAISPARLAPGCVRLCQALVQRARLLLGQEAATFGGLAGQRCETVGDLSTPWTGQQYSLPFASLLTALARREQPAQRAKGSSKSFRRNDVY